VRMRNWLGWALEDGPSVNHTRLAGPALETIKVALCTAPDHLSHPTHSSCCVCSSEAESRRASNPNPKEEELPDPQGRHQDLPKFLASYDRSQPTIVGRGRRCGFMTGFP
jgi:hypothetical protein